MGTRNLTIVMIDCKYKIAQYGQWDGHPEGQGITVLDFLTKHMDKELFMDKCRKTKWIDEHEENLTVDNYPQMSRDHGAEILLIVQVENDGIILHNDIDFAKDSLFCEWAYVIDFDKNTFEAYEGFNTSPLNINERFYCDNYKDKEYYPVRLKYEWDLDNLPSYKKFIETLNETEEYENI